MNYKSIFFFGIFVLLGCSSPQQELQKLCRKDAGLKVYQQFQANVYFDKTCNTLSHCAGNLFKSGLDSIEFYHDGLEDEYKLLEGTYSLEFNSQFCNINLKSLVKKIKEKKVDSCLIIQKVLRPSSRYELVNVYFEDYKNLGSDWSINKSSYAVIDNVTSKAIAEDINFFLFKKNAHKTIFYKSSYSCSNSKNESERSDLIKKVLYK